MHTLKHNQVLLKLKICLFGAEYAHLGPLAVHDPAIFCYFWLQNWILRVKNPYIYILVSTVKIISISAAFLPPTNVMC